MTDELIAVPLPGAAHPAFTAAYLARFMETQVSPDNTVKTMREDGTVDEFVPAHLFMPFRWLVWFDRQGRGIAQSGGDFTLEGLKPEWVLQAPVFADRHVNLPVREGPTPT